MKALILMFVTCFALVMTNIQAKSQNYYMTGGEILEKYGPPDFIDTKDNSYRYISELKNGIGKNYATFYVHNDTCTVYYMDLPEAVLMETLMHLYENFEALDTDGWFYDEINNSVISVETHGNRFVLSHIWLPEESADEPAGHKREY